MAEKDGPDEATAGATNETRDQPRVAKPGDRRPDDDAGTAPELPVLQERASRYYTYFHGSVHIGYLGFGAAQGGQPRTRRVGDQELGVEHRYFVAPPEFDVMAHRLQAQRLLILGGETGTGRRCAGLALLTRSAPRDIVGGGPLVELEPRTTAAALLDASFERGGRYLLAECQPGDADRERLRFALEVLHRSLVEAGAVLVATSSSPALSSDALAVSFRAVDCGEVLDAYLTERDGYDEQTSSLLRSIAARRRAGEMPLFFQRLEQDGPQAVATHFDHSVRDELRGLLSTRPPVPVLLALVVAAFLPRIAERSYEVHLHRLRELVDDHARRGPWTGAYDESLCASRADRPTWVGAHPHPFTPRERSVRLADTVTPGFVLDELWQRYGRELWGPVYEWLTELPGRTGDVDGELALATGMAAFTRIDPVGADAVVDAWAQDDALPQRMAAAATLSALTPDEATAHDALRRAISWSAGKPRLRIVAAMAFGQSLSRVFPVEAMSHLWYLCFGNAVVATAARRQFAALVRAAAHDDDQVRRVLRVVEWQLEQQLSGRCYQDKDIGQAIEAVSAILAAQLADDTTLTLHVLRRLPPQISRLGKLWAEVLRSWPHRVEGLDTLRAAHDGLEPPERAEAFTELGAAVRQHVSPPEWDWMCRDLGVAAWTGTARGDGIDGPAGDAIGSEVGV
jgi:hypothetical protein